MLDLTEAERRELIKLLNTRVPNNTFLHDTRSNEEINILRKVTLLPYKVPAK